MTKEAFAKDLIKKFLENKMSLLYFTFIIINIFGISSLFLPGLRGVFLIIISFIFNIYFFTLNIRIKKTRSATINFILYLVFCICLFIVFIQAIEIENYSISNRPLPTSRTYFFIVVGAISLIVSYTIVLIQMVKHFIKK